MRTNELTADQLATRRALRALGKFDGDVDKARFFLGMDIPAQDALDVRAAELAKEDAEHAEWLAKVPSFDHGAMLDIALDIANKR